MLLCVFYSPKSSTVVLASFCWVSSDFPHSHFGHPPNMVTCVRPGPKRKAVAVWYIRGSAPSGRVSWGEGESWWYWLTSLLEVNVNMTELVISWLVDCQHNCLLRDQLCMETQSVEPVTHSSPLTFLHLPELTSRTHASCRVLSFLSIPPVTSSWGCSSP